MPTNGLRTFAVHRDNLPGGVPALVAADAAAPTGPSFQSAAADPETAARHYVAQYVSGPAAPMVAATANSGPSPIDYPVIGTETVPLTHTRTVKFYQRYYKIPVYGSLITVDLDNDNSFLGLSSAQGEPSGVDLVAQISPQQAQQAIQAVGGDATRPGVAPPRSYFYFDSPSNIWRLVYIAVDVPPRAGAGGTLPLVQDYVVDAHTGEVVAQLPRVHLVGAPLSPAPDVPALGPRSAPSPNGASTPPYGTGPAGALPPPNGVPTPPAPGLVEESASDGLNQARQIRCRRGPTGQLQLYDPVRNVQTYDGGFGDVYLAGSLPGQLVANPPTPWNPAAISVHANTITTADFFATVLLRNGLDNRGGAIISSINCVDQVGSQEWLNAAWLPNQGQVVYGQQLVAGALRSYALSQDVVAHELTHGVTDNTARLVYSGMAGALNESYSDIFGVLVSNTAQPDVSQWNWEIGEDVDGTPLRDLSNPARFQQPDHMRVYQTLPEDRDHDNGGVHINSGIHNKVAYNLLTTPAAGGGYLFTPNEVAALFYLALTQQLSRTAGFADSRRGVEQVALTLFRQDAQREQKLTAVAQAFDGVGITRQDN